MTQKELLYIEDAIGHENTIIKICENMRNNLKDKNLISFIESELQIHNDTKNKLMNTLEVKVNE